MALPEGPGDGVRIPAVSVVTDEDGLHGHAGVESTVFELDEKPPVGVGSLRKDKELEPLPGGLGSITNGLGCLTAGIGTASMKMKTLVSFTILNFSKP